MPDDDDSEERDDERVIINPGDFAARPKKQRTTALVDLSNVLINLRILHFCR